MRRMLIAIALATSLLANASTVAMAQAPDDNCVFDPVTQEWVCGTGGGGGGGGGGEPPSDFEYGPWMAIGLCALAGEDDSILWERQVFYRETGAQVDAEWICADPNWEEAWDQIAVTAAAIGVPQFETAPPASFGAVVGSPALLWYSGQSQIEPITATVTDPTGLTYGVEGRGWIEQITWNMGDNTSVTSRARDAYDDAVFFGDFDNPETQHTYQHTSLTQGYPIDPNRCNLAFSPVSVTLTWTGEYRLIEGLFQTTWTRVPANLDITETFEIPVREIRSALITQGTPAPDPCTWDEP